MRDYDGPVNDPKVVRTVIEFRAALAEVVAETVSAGVPAPVVGLVPTMGALHAGHGVLVDAARAASDVVIASVFVNPLQFEDAEDFRNYPRTLTSDVEILGSHGVDLVFAPDIEQMYPGHPDAPLVRVSAGELGRRWEGASRPRHFDGVVTVVTKLFNIMTPPAPARFEAWFGEKDAEQLAIIGRLVADLDVDVTLRSVPIVRDDDGLALSSRNRRLSPQQRRDAAQLSQTLFALAHRAEAGEPLEVEPAVADLASAQGVELDYLVVVDPTTLRPLQLPADGILRGAGMALVAARVGPVRLIDTMALHGDAER